MHMNGMALLMDRAPWLARGRRLKHMRWQRSNLAAEPPLGRHTLSHRGRQQIHQREVTQQRDTALRQQHTNL